MFRYKQATSHISSYFIMFNGEPEIQTPFQGLPSSSNPRVRSSLCALSTASTAAWIIIEASVKLKFHPEWD
jgi:hypothetical protein